MTQTFPPIEQNKKQRDKLFAEHSRSGSPRFSHKKDYHYAGQQARGMKRNKAWQNQWCSQCSIHKTYIRLFETFWKNELNCGKTQEKSFQPNIKSKLSNGTQSESAKLGAFKISANLRAHLTDFLWLRIKGFGGEKLEEKMTFDRHIAFLASSKYCEKWGEGQSDSPTICLSLARRTLWLLKSVNFHWPINLICEIL